MALNAYFNKFKKKIILKSVYNLELQKNRKFWLHHFAGLKMSLWAINMQSVGLKMHFVGLNGGVLMYYACRDLAGRCLSFLV
jgi:hypothetical protein